MSSLDSCRRWAISSLRVAMSCLYSRRNLVISFLCVSSFSASCFKLSASCFKTTNVELLHLPGSRTLIATTASALWRPQHRHGAACRRLRKPGERVVQPHYLCHE